MQLLGGAFFTPFSEERGLTVRGKMIHYITIAIVRTRRDAVFTVRLTAVGSIESVAEAGHC